MIQDPSEIVLQNLKEEQPEETSNILLFGSKTRTLKDLRSFFRGLQVQLIFLDLSMFYLPVKKEIREDIYRQMLRKTSGNLNETINVQTIDFTEEMCIKTENLLKNCKFVLDKEGFFAIKANGTIKSIIKSKLDAIFGFERFINEIIIDSPFKLWYNPDSTVFERTDYILLYCQSLDPRINPVFNEKMSGGYWHSFVSKGQGTPKKFVFPGKGEVVLEPPPGTHWKLKQETISDLCQKGRIRLNKRGNPEYWVPSKKGQIIDSNWLDIQSFEWNSEKKFTNSSDLYTRLLKLCLNERELFLDISADMGMSLIVANQLKMKWIGIEEKKQLFETVKKNLLAKGIFFSAYECTSLSDQSLDLTSSSFPNNTCTNSIPIQAPSNNSLKLTETYNLISRIDGTSKYTNMLILGDCLEVLPLLEPSFQKQLKMIYIDPPFFTGIDENIVIPIGLSGNRNFHSIEEIAYKNVLDTLNPIEFFKKWFKKRVLLMKHLLTDDGFIFVRFDYHFGHYARMVLDEVFGRNNFVNEFLVRRMKKNLSLKQAHHQTHLIVHSDSLFVYKKSDKAKLNTSYINKRRRKGQDIAERQYSIDNIWIDVAGYEKLKKTLYPTENSETLLSRIIQISSDEGDCIADFFCGSGTTIAVAEKLKRKWVGVDTSPFSIQEIRKRILNISQSSPFRIFNVCKTTQDIASNGLPEVKLETEVDGKILKIRIVEFIPSKSLVKHNKQDFIDYIDFWAIDWNYQGDFFQAIWHSYRKMKGKQVLGNVEITATHVYSKPGTYLVAMIFVDVFGNKSKQSIVITLL